MIEVSNTHKAIICFLIAAMLMVFTIGYPDMKTNDQVHNKTIWISGKLCPSQFAKDSGIVQDETGVSYFIPLNSCQLYEIGKPTDISYNHIHQSFSLSEFDFNRVVGNYGKQP
jgi:hypothetical protein